MPKRRGTDNARDRLGSEDLGDKDRDKKKVKKDTVEWVPDDEDDDLPVQLNLILTLPKDDEPPAQQKAKKPPIRKYEEPALKLSRSELVYYKNMKVDQQKELNQYMKSIQKFINGSSQIPLKFKVLQLPISEYLKATVIKKIETLDDDSNETYKLKNWIDGFMRIPFGKTIPLPVQLKDGQSECSKFMKQSKKVLDNAVYGMMPAKTQVLQVLAQLIANPNSVGNVIALQGPPGIGKTTIAKHGIAEVLQRPFEFFSLGGSSDISNYVGHSYTYEGSLWGRIADSLMKAGYMNPVLYFDEVDKISSTPHGEEVTSMLIHLTDKTQNSQFHDRYFAGVDLDISQCLFVFSFNDISAVHPVLKDRMTVIDCKGYTSVEKKEILKTYVWPKLLDRLKFSKDEVILSEEAIHHMVTEYSDKEDGVRNLIRCAETVITRLNMMRVSDEEMMKEFDFFVNVTFPLVLTDQIVKKILAEKSKKDNESWRSMYV